MSWTDAMTDKLKVLRAAGLSAAKVAQRMRDEDGVIVSRSAVVGKSRRIGIDSSDRKAPPRPKLVVIVAPEPPTDFLGVLFADLERHHCRFAGDGPPYFFCGQPKQDGSPYCAHHHQICYAKPQKRAEGDVPASMRSIQSWKKSSAGRAA